MSRDDSWFSLLSKLGLGKLLLLSATDFKTSVRSDFVCLLVMLSSCPLSTEVITASLFLLYPETRCKSAEKEIQGKDPSLFGVACRNRMKNFS